jgi:hypothetical protein
MIDAMPRTVVHLPPQVQPPFDVYISGVPQHEGTDFVIEEGLLVFPGRELRKDKISGWRWLLGAWGVGTYRQDDSVDVRYQLNGRAAVAEGLEPTVEDEA